MKLRSILAGALASVFVTLLLTCTASADVRIVNDPGGEISSYVLTFKKMRAAGERVVIDGPCLSACTLLTGIVPHNRVCVTKRAILGFHAASYYNDSNREWTPAQVRTLKSLARQKKHAAKIAKALKRTEGATRQKAFSLGVSLNSRA